MQAVVREGGEGEEMSDRCFVSADWINVEGRLTAHFSGDPVLTAELDAELSGGHKVHALNAALIYDIDPADAKTHLVMLKGQMRPAYDAGKRQTHRWNYGGGPRNMAETFWLPLDFCKAVDAKLSAKYSGVAEWRKRLVDHVFGLFLYACGNCSYQQEERGTCPNCSRRGVAVPLRYAGVVEQPARMLYTPFGRLRRYPGKRKHGMNAVAAQLPQGSGASMWYRTFDLLHSPGIAGPPGRLVWDTDGYTYSDLLTAAQDTFVVAGTYDSFLMECPTRDAGKVLEWLVWCMEQPWSELGGKRFPAEGSVGGNWEKWHERNNPGGLREVAVRPLSVSNPYM